MARKGSRVFVTGKRFVDMGKEVEAEVKGAVGKTAEAVASKYKQAILTGPKTGRIYKRHGVEHQASAEGEAPANDVGTLANSISVDLSRLDTEFRADVVAGANYAGQLESLEEGDAVKSPRPALGPAMDSEAPNFNRRIRKAFDKVTGEAGGGGDV